jgi:hypothetical protein
MFGIAGIIIISFTNLGLCDLFKIRITSGTKETVRRLVEFPGRRISPTQGLYLSSTMLHKNTRTNIYTISGIRTYDPTIQEAMTHALDGKAPVIGTLQLFYWII